MNTQPTVLLYNFNDPDRLRIIRRYLNRQKVNVRIVTPPEFLHPLGYLFELPGFQPSTPFNLGKNFSDEMMVLNNFSSEHLGNRRTGNRQPACQFLLADFIGDQIHPNALPKHFLQWSYSHQHLPFIANIV